MSYTYKGKTPIDYAAMSCDTLMAQYSVEELPPKNHFHYHQGVFLSGMWKSYEINKEQKYHDYVKAWVDQFVTEDGEIMTLDPDELDDCQPGILLLELYKETKQKKYKKAILNIENILKNFPRNSEGGYWHKVKNKEQMWLDGLYMAGPFEAGYSILFDDKAAIENCIFQIELMREKTMDKETGLWFHAWDSQKIMKWADKETGRSAFFWGRSLGWVPVAILDELELMDKTSEEYKKLAKITTQLLDAIIKYQSKEGLWYQVLDHVDQKDNWLETSCSSLFCAAICKAVRLGIYDSKKLDIAKKAFEGIIDTVEIDNEKLIVKGICVGTGVGDYEHYINRPTKDNDLHGVGAFLLMCEEAQRAF